jgi:hypothetical protein
MSGSLQGATLMGVGVARYAPAAWSGIPIGDKESL